MRVTVYFGTKATALRLRSIHQPSLAEVEEQLISTSAVAYVSDICHSGSRQFFWIFFNVVVVFGLFVVTRAGGEMMKFL